jgi:hypothetical protein
MDPIVQAICDNESVNGIVVRSIEEDCGTLSGATITSEVTTTSATSVPAVVGELSSDVVLPTIER